MPQHATIELAGNRMPYIASVTIDDEPLLVEIMFYYCRKYVVHVKLGYDDTCCIVVVVEDRRGIIDNRCVWLFNMALRHTEFDVRAIDLAGNEIHCFGKVWLLRPVLVIIRNH